MEHTRYRNRTRRTDRLINRLNLEIQGSRTELRNGGLTEPARLCDLRNIGLPDNAQLRTHYVTLSKRCRRTVTRHGNSPNAMSMMANMQATRRRWEELNTELKGSDEPCCQPEKIIAVFVRTFP